MFAKRRGKAKMKPKSIPEKIREICRLDFTLWTKFWQKLPGGNFAVSIVIVFFYLQDLKGNGFNRKNKNSLTIRIRNRF